LSSIIKWLELVKNLGLLNSSLGISVCPCPVLYQLLKDTGAARAVQGTHTSRITAFWRALQSDRFGSSWV